MRKQIFFLLGFIFLLGIASASPLNNTLHATVQITNSSGSILTGTYNLTFSLSNDSACNNLLFTQTFLNQKTDDRGIIDEYLTGINISFDQQLWLKYTRSGISPSCSEISLMPYSYYTNSTNLSNINIDTNLNLSSYNISQANNINATGNISALNFLGNLNWSYVLNSPAFITWANAVNGTLATLNQVLNFNYYNSTNFPYTSLSNFSNNLNFLNWSGIDNGTFYYKSNPFGFYNSTTIPAYMLQSTYNTNYTTLYLNSNPYSFYNSTTLANVSQLLNDANYTTNISSLAYANSTGLIINWSQVLNGTGLIRNWNASNLIINWSNVISGSSFWNQSGSNLYPSNLSWNVGIGTSSPIRPLTINTSNPVPLGIYSTDTSLNYSLLDIINSNNSYMRLGVFNWGAGILAGNNYSVAGTTPTISLVNGNVGIGTTTPQNIFNVIGDINATTNLYANGLNVTGLLPYITNGTFASYSFGSNNFNGSGYFNTSGQVNASAIFLTGNLSASNIIAGNICYTNGTNCPSSSGGIANGTNPYLNSLLINSTSGTKNPLNITVAQTIGFCYQQSANDSTIVSSGLSSNPSNGACILNYNGGYNYTGTWTNPGNFIDGNWGTNASIASPGSGSWYYVNYSIPYGANNGSVWQFKDYAGIFNITVGNYVNISAGGMLQLGVEVINEPSSFLAGTKILMADGNYKNIQDIKVGDMVLAYNNATGKNVAENVFNIFKDSENSYLMINNKIDITPKHIVYLNGKWQNISNAKIGNYLTDENGRRIYIYSIKKINKTVETYDIELSEIHTFYADNILVHNPVSANHNVWQVYETNGTGWVIVKDNDLGSNSLTNLSEMGMWWNISSSTMPLVTSIISPTANSINIGTSSLVTINNLLNLSLISQFPSCNSNYEGTIGRNSTGLYYCANPTWKQIVAG